MLKDKVAEIADLFNGDENRTLFLWGGSFAIDESFCRLKMVFVYVLYKYEGVIRAKKIAGTLCVKDGVSKIIFSTDLLRASNSRTHYKRVVTIDDLCDDDTSYPAGLSKRLEIGTLPYQLSETREGDRALVDVLHQFTGECPILTDKIVHPIAYLCAKDKRSYSPKSVVGLIHCLKESDAYNEDNSIYQNFQHCFEDSFHTSSEGRWLVNYDWVTGRGIPYMDMESVYGVYEYKGDITQIDYEDQTFIFKMSNSIER